MDLRNVVKDLKTQIDDFIENNSTKELEFVFGRSIKPNNYYSKINKGLFQDLLRRLNSLDFQKDDIEQLDIIVNDSDIRATLVGRQNIVLYCKENMDVLDNLTYDYKKPDARKSHVEIVNYGIRSNLKVEIPIDNITDRSNELTKKYNNLLDRTDSGTIYDLNKKFRYKKRISYKTNDGFNIDLTVVKSNCGVCKSFKSSDLLNMNESYEVEIECDFNEIKQSNRNTDYILDRLVSYSGIILQTQQNCQNIISIEKQEDVLKDIKNILKNANNKLYTDYSVDYNDISHLCKTLKHNGISLSDIGLSTIEIEYQNNILDKKTNEPYTLTNFEYNWPGPKPISLEMKNVQSSDKCKSHSNILKHYTVTDKADGEGNLLYFDRDEGKGYLIDPSNRVRETGLICESEKGTLLNGEYITNNLQGEVNYSFYAYDIYLKNGRSINLLPLCYPDNIISPSTIELKASIELDGKEQDISIIYNDQMTVSGLVNYASRSVNIKNINKMKYCIKSLNINGTTYDINDDRPLIFIFKSLDDKPSINFTATETEESEKKRIEKSLKKVLKDAVNNEFVSHEYIDIGNFVSITDGLNRNEVEIVNRTPLLEINRYKYTFNGSLTIDKNVLQHNIDNKQYIVNLPTRLLYMNQAIRNVNSNFMENYMLKVYPKKFYYSNNDDSSIFNLSEICWRPYTNGTANYKYDGLIYTPMYIPVGYSNSFKTIFNTLSDKRREKGITFNTLPGNTWNLNFKWKPPDENSIDFLVITDKNTIMKSSNKYITKDTVYMNTNTSNDQVEIKKYKKLNLYVGSNNIYTDPCNNKYSTRKYSKKQFNPVVPIVDNVGTANIILDNNRMFGEDDKNLIEDNTIVEFYYSFTESNGLFRWKPKRTRYDKTYAYHTDIQLQKDVYNSLKLYFKNQEYNKTRQYLRDKWSKINTSNELMFNLKKHFQKTNEDRGQFEVYRSKFSIAIKSYDNIPINKMKFGNDENVANNIWKTIHNPVTTHMITHGNIPGNLESEIKSEEVYYNTTDLPKRQYRKTIHLQRFHNFIKRNILLQTAANNCKHYENRDIRILDLACGKGGDLTKWKDISAKIVVGFDKVNDNLINKKDGACVRYNEMVHNNTNKNIPKVYFLQADSSHNIDRYYLEDVSDITNKKLYSNLWNSNEYYKTKLSQSKFNIVSLQFALHYFCENETSLNGLIKNVSDNISTGGLFIGTCFNGLKVCESLMGKDFKEGKEANGDLIWKITKKYTDNSNCESIKYNKKIDVYMKSINATHSEYLVDFKEVALKLQNKKYKLRCLTHDDFENCDFPSALSTHYDENTGTIAFQKIAEYLLSIDEQQTGVDVLYCVEKNIYRKAIIDSVQKNIYTITDIETKKSITKSNNEIYILQGMSLKDVSYIKQVITSMTPVEKEISYFNSVFLYIKN